MLALLHYFKTWDSSASYVKVESVSIRTHCVRCGAQIEKEVKVYKGQEFLNTEWLNKEDIHPDEVYTFVHLLCYKCDMLMGFQKETEKI